MPMASHARASAIIGAGTLVSRLTGLVRSMVLISVVGLTTSDVADAFATANALPTNIYELVAAGVITGIIVPQIVGAARHRDGGSGYVSKLLTLGTVLMVAVTVIVLALAPALIWIYTPGYTPQQRALTLALAYWCLPQLLFYGLYALVGEVLNARRVFGPYSWAPTVNNLVSIVGFLVFLAMFGGPLKDVDQWDAAKIAVLGGTATLGIALQAFVLAFFWRRTGLSVRADFAWRGMGLRHLGKLGFWTFLTVVVGQGAGLVQQRTISFATESGFAVFLTAWLIFMLPHSIVAMSISTTYFTQLAEQVAEGRTDLVQGNLDESIRALSVFAFGFTAALAAASVPVSVFFTGERDGASLLALNVCAFLVALVPFGILVIIRRAFFAFHDTRTPFQFSVVQCVLAAGGVAELVEAHRFPNGPAPRRGRAVHARQLRHRGQGQPQLREDQALHVRRTRRLGTPDGQVRGAAGRLPHRAGESGRECRADFRLVGRCPVRVRLPHLRETRHRTPDRARQGAGRSRHLLRHGRNPPNARHGEPRQRCDGRGLAHPAGQGVGTGAKGPEHSGQPRPAAAASPLARTEAPDRPHSGGSERTPRPHLQRGPRPAARNADGRGDAGDGVRA